MLNSIKCVLASFMLVSTTQAQIIFHEPFDFGPGVQTLGNENGWQASFNDTAPSVVPLAPRHTMEASPFSVQGLAIQPANSKMTSYRKLPTSLNGKNVFFSYTMKSFGHKHVSAVQFRSTNGAPFLAGFLGGRFGVRGHKAEQFTDPIEFKKSYFVVGQIQISEDGRQVGLAATYYTAPEMVPQSAPASTDEWPVMITFGYGKTQTWEGVGFQNASANGAFDDLRIGYTWYDVTGRH